MIINNGIKNQLRGSSGEHMVAAILFRWGISVVSTGQSDFGEDLICDILLDHQNDNKVVKTNLVFRVQVKTTKDITNSKYIRSVGENFAVNIKTKLLNKWSNSFFPVLVVIWDEKTDTGYWSISPEEGIDLNNSKEMSSVYFANNNIFNKSEDIIKRHVTMYYDNIFKLRSGTYTCSVLPFYMPSYKNINIINYPININKDNVVLLDINTLPSFILSYDFIETYSNRMYAFEVHGKYESLEAFITSVEKEICKFAKVESLSECWISFVVSPISILTSNNIKLSTEMTNWMSYSLIQENLVTDFSYTFPIYNESFNKRYYPTVKTRAMSIDNDLECQPFSGHSSI